MAFDPTNLSMLEIYKSSASAGGDCLGGVISPQRLVCTVPIVESDTINELQINHVSALRIAGEDAPGIFPQTIDIVGTGEDDFYLSYNGTDGDPVEIAFGETKTLILSDTTTYTGAIISVTRRANMAGIGTMTIRTTGAWNNSVIGDDIVYGDTDIYYSCHFFKALCALEITGIYASNCTVYIGDIATSEIMLADHSVSPGYTFESSLAPALSMAEGEYAPLWFRVAPFAQCMESAYALIIFDVDGETYFSAIFGARRVADESLAGYVLYEADDTDTAGGVAVATSATLPFTYEITPPISGTEVKRYRITKRNKYGIESMNVYLDKSIEVDTSGDETTAPAQPQSVVVAPMKNGYCSVTVEYEQEQDHSDAERIVISATDGVTTLTATRYMIVGTTSYEVILGPFSWGYTVTATVTAYDARDRAGTPLADSERLDMPGDSQTLLCVHGAAPSMGTQHLFLNSAYSAIGDFYRYRAEPGIAGIFGRGIPISTIEELQAIGTAGYPLNGYYYLTNDIDASDTATWNAGAGFVPISGVFTGTLNGAGRTIDALEIHESGAVSYTAIFRDMRGTILNLKITDADISSDFSVAILAGSMSADAIIDNCYINGEVLTSYESGGVGGIAYTNQGTISNCVAVEIYAYQSGTTGNEFGGLVGQNSGTITQSIVVSGHVNESLGSIGNYAGGICGYNYSGGAITECTTWGTYVQGASYIGGLVGENNAGTVTNSYSITGTAEASVSYVGGLIGRDTGIPSPVEYCYAANFVTGAATNQGGLIGAGSALKSYYDSTVSGQSDNTGKGFPRTTAQMKDQATFVDWDFTDIWAITPTEYPHLQDVDDAIEPNDLIYVDTLIGIQTCNGVEAMLGTLTYATNTVTGTGATPITINGSKICFNSGGDTIATIDTSTMIFTAASYDTFINECAKDTAIYETPDRVYFQCYDTTENVIRTWLVIDNDGTVYFPFLTVES